MATSGMRDELLGCYRAYVGELDEVTEVDVYAGVGLSMAGFLAAVAGWGLYAYDETLPHGTAQFRALRELSVAVAGVGVPVLLLGVVVLLLGNSRTTRLSLAGLVACLGAVVLFVYTYPQAWSVAGPDASVVGVGAYGAGVLAMTFAAGAAFSCRLT